MTISQLKIGEMFMFNGVSDIYLRVGKGYCSLDSEELFNINVDLKVWKVEKWQYHSEFIKYEMPPAECDQLIEKLLKEYKQW